MLFASDLDRTLMYSKRAIAELGLSQNSVLKPVEKKADSWVGFMTESSYLKLKELSEQSMFVPVTTRTTDQFNRFALFQKDIPLTYAITCNGAAILYKGKLLHDWSTHMQRSLKEQSVSQAELMTVLLKEGIRLDGEMRQVEGLFFYFILTCLPTAAEREIIHTLVEQYGWRISLQGRKLYFIPKAVSKGSALNYICQQEGQKAVAGAGDSVLDWDFLKLCHHRFVPKHGELTKHSEVSGADHYILTSNAGIVAGEEILQHFLRLLLNE